jgi:hypothetical protein
MVDKADFFSEQIDYLKRRVDEHDFLLFKF